DFLSVPELGPTHPTVAFLHQLANFPKPIVAAVAGLAIGIGTTALLHCELVYAAPGCRFQLPFTKLGLCPEAASSLLLPRLVGYQRAAQYLLLAEPFNSEQALQMGLVNELVAPEALSQHAQQKARQLAALPAEAVRISKALLKQTAPALSNVISDELVHFQQLLQSEACQQQLKAFLTPK
ncbi:enoyl-CoA hydratase-related protein, partial [Arsukibacterium sp.]|uniref:enoyl-CoA hydratase-related protein n=1 Tax=Arsukibacterium sp. TaxID=1977258 RepID=UPI002FDB0E8D